MPAWAYVMGASETGLSVNQSLGVPAVTHGELTAEIS
jgi:hypothetical protein